MKYFEIKRVSLSTGICRERINDLLKLVKEKYEDDYSVIEYGNRHKKYISEVTLINLIELLPKRYEQICFTQVYSKLNSKGEFITVAA